MKERFTEIVFILDKSGSMHGLEKDTIGGFNSLIQKQKKEDGKVIVSTVLFDDESYVIHDRIDIENIKPLTEKEYYAGGSTALLDAVGGAINHIGHIHKHSRKQDIPDKTMFIIMTDGCENASYMYSYRKVKRLIRNQKEKYEWEFLFLGANIDSISEAKKYGIDADMAVEYNCDSAGTALNYEVLSDAITDVRNCVPMSAGWKKRIEEDRKSRRSED